MSTLEALRLFTNGTDYVVAKDVDDAWVQWSEHSGEEREDYDGSDGWKWEAMPDNAELGIWCDGEGDVCEVDEDGGESVTRTASTWVERAGRGWLASTEH